MTVIVIFTCYAVNICGDFVHVELNFMSSSGDLNYLFKYCYGGYLNTLVLFVVSSQNIYDKVKQDKDKTQSKEG